MSDKLIGVHGKINSGKDLVGQIVQYFTSHANEKYTFENYQTIYNRLGEFGIGYLPEWEVKKFADKLKDIVCLLLGCTRHQLEDREYKNTELGPDWMVYTVEYGDKLYLYDDYDSADVAWELPHAVEPRQMTPRLLLQLMGTDCGRNIIHPNIWINATFADWKPIKYESFVDEDRIHNATYEVVTYPSWVITDCRFPNECDTIRQWGGINISINRPKKIVLTGNITTDILNNTKDFGVTEHYSETALDHYKDFDYTIINDGTIDDLVTKVHDILIKEKFIDEV